MVPMQQVYQTKETDVSRPFERLRGVVFPSAIWFWSALATLADWDARRRARLHFATLDDRGLADVGLTRDQQRIECAKPFWQL
jgi:uncharacterized protein YjiS (DUF1127 family)